MKPEVPAERDLLAAFMAGQPLDLGRRQERVIRGAFLADLLVSVSHAEREVRHGALKLSHAAIHGDIDLEGAVVDLVLALTHCHFDGRWGLEDAELRGLRLTGSTVQSLAATNLRVHGNLVLNDGFTSTARTDLVGAHVSGDARLSRSVWNRSPEATDAGSPRGVALMASRMRVDGGFLASGLRASGQVRMIGARIGGLLNLAGAELDNSGGISLHAERVEVGESLYFMEGFLATGRVILQNSTIRGGVDAVESRFEGGTDDRLGLNVVRAKIGRNLSMIRATVTQDLSMRAAEIGGTVALVGTEFGAASTVDASRLSAATVNTRWASPPAVLDLRHARCEIVEDDPGRWPARLHLGGFTYGRLDERPGTTAEDRLRWLNLDPAGYQPQLYDQLTRCYRQLGDEEQANRVALQKQRERRATLPAPAQALGLIQDVFVGYGFRIGRAVAWLLSLVVVGSWVFEQHQPAALDNAPPFNSWVYAADLVLPVFGLGHAEHFAPVGATRFLAWSLVVVGWGLTAALVAGVTRAVSRP